MATIYQSDIVQKAVRGLKLAPSRDKIPNELADKILPVYELNDAYDIITAGGSSSSSSSTASILTASSTADTYITSLMMSVDKDATSDSTDFSVNVVQNGAVRALGKIIMITLTATSKIISISFPRPVRIDKGSTVRIAATFTVGALSRSAAVTYYEIPSS